MVLEQSIPDFFTWVIRAGLIWAAVTLALILLTALISFLLAGLRMGPKMAGKMVLHVIRQAISDIFWVSFQRIRALALLTFKEAVRRKIVVGFILFIFIVLFAGMFLDPSSRHPLQLYVEFIFTTTGYLVLLLMLLLTAFSLPSDIQKKTIHTIVTKPVKISEIVLGRILGFVVMGTVLMAGMGILSYGFVVRSQSHTHTLDIQDMTTLAERTPDGVSPARSGKTSLAREHRHDVYIAPGGENVEIEMRNDHSHQVSHTTLPDGSTRYILSGPTEMYHARIPQYGLLKFRDEMGLDKNEGVNVGDEWEYRSFISGQSKTRAIWLFDNITPQRFSKGLPVELTLEVFRTYKGLIDRRILGTIMVRNPATGLAVEMRIFESVEHGTDSFIIPTTIKPIRRAEVITSIVASQNGQLLQFPPEGERDYGGADKSEFDLFNDLVAKEFTYFDGKTERVVKNAVEIWVRCLEPGQYFGAAQHDMYLRAGDSSFTWNFCKGYLGIWFQMVLVIAYGVLFSTFLSTPVALFATFFVVLGGFFHSFLADLGTGSVLGGGPWEAFIRMINQENITIELDLTTPEMIMANIFDSIFQGFMWFFSHLLPSLTRFDASVFVSKGFNIPLHLLAIHFIYVLSFVFPLYVTGYLFLKTREIEK
ncbi:MAG: hypothetical protein Q4C96_00305 [Planctomycetia bacterium]|nr:hypothetical protein [Planctomycetia bacterium]